MDCPICRGLERAFEAGLSEYIEARSSASFRVCTKLAAHKNVEMERARYAIEEHRLVCVSAVRVFTTLAATGRVYEFETTGRIILCRFSSVAGPGLAVVGQDRLVDYRQTRR
jgi:hypothetical protein